jgi:hypothetical protein
MTVRHATRAWGTRSRLESGPPVTAVKRDGDFDVTSLGMSYLHRWPGTRRAVDPEGPPPSAPPPDHLPCT